jgi:peroxiredoxin
MTFKERIEKYKKKSLAGKISDIIFIIFIITMLVPSGRLAVGGFVNRIKSMVVQPSVNTEKNAVQLNDKDYNWQLTNINGKPVKLTDYKNKVIFLNFWATWCPPCVGEMPAIQDLYDTYKNDDRIQFLLVTNDSSQNVKDFIKKRTYTFPVFTYAYRPPEVFSSSVIPTTFIISKKGKIMVKETGASNWNGEKTLNLVKKLINE